MNSRIALLALLWLFIVIPTAIAAPFGDGLDDALGAVGDTMASWVQNDGFRFGITFILFFMVLYAVFAAGLNRVSAFKGKGEQPNKQGKTIAVSMGLMGAMGVAYWANFSAAVFTERVLSYMGFFGAVGFAFAVFALTYYNMKKDSGEANWGMVLVATGLALMAYGLLMGPEVQNVSSQTMFSLGMVLVFIGLILMMTKAVGPKVAEDVKNAAGGGSGGSGGSGSGGEGRPAPPHSFNGKFKPDGTVELTWSPPSEKVDHYDIQRQAPKGIKSKWYRPGTWGSWRNDRSYTESGSSSSSKDSPDLSKGTRFRYRIRAVNSAGRSDWATADVGIDTTDIKVKVEHTDGRYTAPIEKLKLTLNGATTHEFTEEPNDKGLYIAKDVPQLASAYHLDIEDPYGVFQKKHFPKLFNPSTHDGSTVTIHRLVPRTGVGGTVTCQVQAWSGHHFPRGRLLRVHGIGGFGMSPQSGQGTQNIGNNSEVKVKVPAGHIVGLYIRDPSGEHADYDGYTNGAYVFTRFTGDTPFDNPIKLSPGKPLKINGTTYRMSTPNTPPKNLANIPVQFQNNVSGNWYPSSPAMSDSNGAYGIKPIYSSVYRVTAPAKHYVLYNPNGYFNKYPVHSQYQKIDLPFLPGSPVPTSVGLQNGKANVGFNGSHGGQQNSGSGSSGGGGQNSSGGGHDGG